MLSPLPAALRQCHRNLGLSPRVAKCSTILIHRHLGTEAAPKPVSDVTRQCYLKYHEDPEDRGIISLVLNQPKSRNAISRVMLSEMREALAHVGFDTSARILVLQSATSNMFCAGADLKERATMTHAQVSRFLYDLKQTFREIETLKIPTVAAIDGPSLGGGLEIALCCDFRFAGPRAVVGLPEASLAIIPGAGGTQRLTRIVGPSLAKQLIFTAARLDHAQARRLGIVNSLINTDDGAEDRATSASGLDQAMHLARQILPQAPLAVQMSKKAIDEGLVRDIGSALEIEQLCYAQLLGTEDRLEGLRAFKEKRKPIYKGQ